MATEPNPPERWASLRRPPFPPIATTCKLVTPSGTVKVSEWPPVASRPGLLPRRSSSPLYPLDLLGVSLQTRRVTMKTTEGSTITSTR